MKSKSQTKELPNIEILDMYFLYDELCGVLRWKDRPPSCFKNHRAMAITNSKYSGAAVGSINKDGYLQVRICGKTLLVSRIIWKLATRVDPVGYLIDHANRDRTDNRLSNLRLASHSDNSTNKHRKQRGVTWNKSCNKWQAQFTKGGKCYYLGVFESKDSAIIVADTARRAAFNEFYNSEITK